MNRRNVLRACAALAASSCVPAFSQSANGSVMTMIVPYPAGGASDVFARALSPALGRELGRTIIIENISGASGSIGAIKALAGRVPGDTLFMASPTDLILAPLLIKSARYTPGDFKLIGLVDKAPLTLFVRPNLAVGSFDELVAQAGKPGAQPVTYGTTGPGSFYHLVADTLQRASGLPMTHVPYRGGAPLLQDLLAGNIDMTLLPASVTIRSMAEAGKIKALAVVSSSRVAKLPQVATLGESRAAARFTAPEMWAGVMVPSTTPAERTQELHAAMTRALAVADVHRALESAAAGSVPPMVSLAEAEAFYRQQTQTLQAAARTARIEAQ